VALLRTGLEVGTDKKIWERTFGILLRANVRKFADGPKKCLPVRFDPEPSSALNLNESDI
jgi:hypothetical protein